MTFGSLFAGIGGMDLGLERAGMQCKWQVEIDPYARRVLERHWPDVRRWDDVRTFPPVGYSDGEQQGSFGGVQEGPHAEPRRDGGDWSVDLICGGFPCQDISFAGKGAGLAGERSGLWYEFARVVRVLRPRYVLVENVAALLVRGLDAVLGTLASIGYDAEWACLPAAAVGAPHIRDRVFIVAHATSGRFGEGSGREGPARERRAEPGVCGDARAHAAGDGRQQRRAEPAGLVGEPALASGRGEVSDADLPRLAQRLCFGGDARAELAAFERANRQAGGQWGADPADDPESGVGRVVARVPHRVDRLRGLGNAVVPQVAEFIGRMILRHAEASS